MPLTDQNENVQEAPTVYGSGSVAHQIIGQFLAKLSEQDGYEEIAGKLRELVFQSKVSEAALRAAIFGEEEL
jgi:hypothetical protein